MKSIFGGRPRRVFGASMALLIGGVTAVAAEPGVSSDKIIFGQAAALEGPASALGMGMKLGIRAAFAAANANGGVSGKTLELISYDDSYEPEKSIAAVNKLINQDKVFLTQINEDGSFRSVAKLTM